MGHLALYVSLRPTNRLMTSLTQVTSGTRSAPMGTDNHSNSASHFLLPTPHQSPLGPQTPNLKTINLSLPQPTPHLTTSTTPFLIITISTRSAPDQTTDSHVNPSPTRQWIDLMRMSAEHMTMPDVACHLHGPEPPYIPFIFSNLTFVPTFVQQRYILFFIPFYLY